MGRGRKGARSEGKSRGSGKGQGPSIGRPVMGILLLGSCLVFLLGLSTYRPHQPAANWAGPLGHGLAAALLGVTGVGAYAGVLFLALVAISLLAGHPKLSFSRTLSWLVACGLA